MISTQTAMFGQQSVHGNWRGNRGGEENLGSALADMAEQSESRYSNSSKEGNHCTNNLQVTQ